MIDTFDFRAAHTALVTRIIEGNGVASAAERRAALDNGGLPEPLGGLVKKVALQPTHITGGDFTAAKDAGFTDDQLFELVICAAVGQSSRQYDAACAALDVAAGANAEGDAHAT